MQPDPDELTRQHNKASQSHDGDSSAAASSDRRPADTGLDPDAPGAALVDADIEQAEPNEPA